MMNVETMTKEYTETHEEFVLEATIALHNLIKDDESYCGYDSSFECFTDLYNQVTWLVSNQIHPECLDQENVIAAWNDMQLGVVNGDVEPDWQNY
jgi:hypothetical protein